MAPQRIAKATRTLMRRQSSRESRLTAAGSVQSVDAAEARAAFKKTRAASDLNNPKALFADAQTAKSAALRRICHVDPLKSLYRSDGFGVVVNSATFTQASTALVLANTLWIAVETDNKEADGHIGHWLISIDSAFCLLFLIELTVRFLALKRLHFFCTDAWLMLDTSLAVMNIVEAWLVPSFSSDQSTDGTSGPLRVLRVLRLSRIARTLTLFRLIPELTLLIRSITQALRAVFAVICLLMLFVYVNALYFTGLARGTQLETKFFKDVPTSMKSLIVHGTLLDEIGEMMDLLGEESIILTALFVVFVFVTACLLLNMLVGVLVEVVTVTASVEQEEHLGQFVIEALQQALLNIGHDGKSKVTRKQFERVVRQGVMNEVLRVLNISMDRQTLLSYIFEPEGDHVDTVGISPVVLTLLQLRATSPATVRDVLDARRIILQRLNQLEKVVQKAGGEAPAASAKKAPRGGERRGGFVAPAAGGSPSPRASVCSDVPSQSPEEQLKALMPARTHFGHTASLREGVSKQLYQEFSQLTGKLKELQDSLHRDLMRTMPSGATSVPPQSVYDDVEDAEGGRISGEHNAWSNGFAGSYSTASDVPLEPSASQARPNKVGRNSGMRVAAARSESDDDRSPRTPSTGSGPGSQQHARVRLVDSAFTGNGRMASLPPNMLPAGASMEGPVAQTRLDSEARNAHDENKGRGLRAVLSEADVPHTADLSSSHAAQGVKSKDSRTSQVSRV
mmetsp:Transcript_2483/g.6217  ORF Transcript_2483/g.6217 Transcript_2483/m.6217 type:complete len:737 (-) Transcript_2483:46-2256(-)